MFKIKSKELRKKLTRANVEEELRLNGWNEYDLAKHYIDGFKKLNTQIKSDLRDNDKNNSLLTRVHNGKLVISDFGLKTGMNIYNYLILKHSCSFIQTLNTIRNDFNLDRIEKLPSGRVRRKVPVKHNKIIKETLPVKIEVKRTRYKSKVHWLRKDIRYWKQYGISTNKLEEKKIAPLDTFWITNYNTNGRRTTFDVSKDLCYVYPSFRNKEGFFMYKLYIPEGFKNNNNFKWISNVNKKVIQNIEHIPKSGDLLIIQSSYKDIMLMEELDSSVNVIAPNGEGIWFEDEAWNQLRKNWKRIVLFANNDSNKEDNPGLAFARKHSEKYNIPFVCTPNGTTSDISDYYKEYGKGKTQVLLKEILNNINLIT